MVRHKRNNTQNRSDRGSSNSEGPRPRTQNSSSNRAQSSSGDSRRSDGQPRRSDSSGQRRSSHQGENRGRRGHRGRPQQRRNRQDGRYHSQGKPRLSRRQALFQKFLRLHEQYWEARAHFFRHFSGESPGRSIRQRRHYYRKLQELREFELNLKDFEQEMLKFQLDSFPPDLDYSHKNQIEHKGKVEAQAPFENIHFLPTQATSFKGDTDESTGSMEDYQKLQEEKE